MKRRHHAFRFARPYTDLPTVQRTQPADDGQSNATALRVAGMRAAIAALEQARGVLLAEARPGIDDFHRIRQQANDDLALLGVLPAWPIRLPNASILRKLR